jgi:phosphoglycolate phosphatase
MPTTRAVIFDFDGTLTELTLDFQALRSEIIRIARRYVSETTIAELKDYFILEMIYEIERRLEGDGSRFKDETFEMLRILELEAAKGKDLYPYTRPVLSLLKRKGLKIGIITRTCMDVLRSVFPDIDEYVEGIVTRDHIREVKPHPDHIWAICRALSIVPEEGLLAGDHPTDILAGKAAGMRTIGLLAGRTGKGDFEDAGADYVIQDIRAIPDLVCESACNS